MSSDLQGRLRNWTNLDAAQYSVGMALGLIPSETEFSTDPKPKFWTNLIGDALLDILDTLTDADVLERRDEPDIQYRWLSASAEELSQVTRKEAAPVDSVLLITSAVVAVDPACDDIADAVEPSQVAALDALSARLESSACRARYIVLDSSRINCGRCVRCGAWVTDRTLPRAQPDLPNGATHLGELLCDDHLPSDHRWAF